MDFFELFSLVIFVLQLIQIIYISGGDEMLGISTGALVAIAATFFTIAGAFYIILREKKK